ncbi:hypothetical protein MMC22_007083 [Lobaria immixta]|nr:hypothetical protein [Lobaria immixta]
MKQSIKKQVWGLLELHNPANFGIDILAVHGINGHRRFSWTSVKGICWLEDVPPREIPNAPVFSYEYPTATPITSVAQDLIVTLDERQMKWSSYEVPIVFVAHSTGGLIVREALTFLASHREESQTRILTNTRSLLFLGVSHRGLRAPTIQKVMSFYRIVGFLPRLFEGKSTRIWPTTDDCRRMLEAFAPISDRFEIFTFCDSMRSVTDHLFDPMTYYMGLPNERVIHLNSTYRDMIKLSSLNADLMKIVGPIRSTFIKLGPTPQSRNLSLEQVFRLDGVESESSKQWFSDLRSEAHHVTQEETYTTHASETHSTKAAGISADEDHDGHGTHSAHLALVVAPHTKLFVARIVRYGTTVEFNANTMNIANAIRLVVEQDVDIISMSLGYRAEIPEIQAAIMDAFHKGTIIIAAASNSGVNPRYPISFPANMRQVICIHSSDGEGNPSPRNPSPTPDCNLAILGEGVAAAWPRLLNTDREDGLRVASGSSVATLIAAGFASLVMITPPRAVRTMRQSGIGDDLSTVTR